MSLQLELKARLLELPDVEERKSRFGDQLSFFVGKREFAHFHNKNEIDVRLTRFWIRKLGLNKSEDRRFHLRSPSAEWIEIKFKSDSDLEETVKILEVAAKANRTP